MSIRPCDLTNEQWAALRRESEQKAAPEAKKELEANDSELGPITHYRNGVPVRAGNTQTPSVASKWQQMGDAARKQRNTAFTNDQIRNRGTE